MLFNCDVSAVCTIVAIAICERVRIGCMRAETVTISSEGGGMPAGGESFTLFENETVGVGDKTFSSPAGCTLTVILRGLPGGESELAREEVGETKVGPQMSHLSPCLFPSAKTH
jgi:hypothetical protein